MKNFSKLFVVPFVLLLAAPAAAQTATGTGVGVSESNSAAGAVAINRGNGGNSSLVVNNPANTTSQVNSTVSGTTTSNINQRVSGTQTIKSAPPIAAPSLAAAGLETCLGSASGGVSWLGTGIVGGSTYTDEGCQARLDSRTLASYGLKAAAVARLCQRVDIWRSMPDICRRYWPAGEPYPSGVAVVVAAGGPAPIVMSSNTSDGAIRVIDGRDGVEKDCLSYNSAKQKCLHWSGERPRQRVASVNPTKSTAPAKPKASSKPLAPATAVAKSPAVQAIESATSDQPKKDE